MRNRPSRPTEPWIAAFVLGLVACAPSGAASSPKATATAATAAPAAASGPRVVLPSGKVVDVELARNDAERSQGLMFRESMPRGHGMVFLFDDLAIRPFWMKNCHFALDMIFTKADGTIVDVLKNVPPCAADPCPSFPPKAASDTVLEVNAGVADEGKAVPGAKLVYRDVPNR